MSNLTVLRTVWLDFELACVPTATVPGTASLYWTNFQDFQVDTLFLYTSKRPYDQLFGPAESVGLGPGT